MTSFADDLYTFLVQAEGVGEAVSDETSPETFRIFPVFAHENPTLPCLIYRTISSVRDFTFDGPLTYVSERLQIDIIADTYSSCKTLSEALRVALNGYSSAMGSTDVHYAHLENSQDFYDAEASFSRISMDFIITHSEGE